jgi:hypothetical protein
MFNLDTPVYFTNETDHRDKCEIFSMPSYHATGTA